MLHHVRWIGILGLLAVPLGAGAESPEAGEAEQPRTQLAPRPQAQPQAARAGWNDSHMRSNFNASASGRATRPPVQGASGYGALADGSSETRTQIPDTLETTTQRNWEQGPLRPTATKREKPANKGGSGRISRGSTLRGGAVSNSR